MDPPAKVEQLLELLNDPAVKSWLEARPAAAAEAQTADDFASRMEAGEAALRNRINGLRSALPRLPQELAAASAIAARDIQGGRPGTVVAILAVLVAVGAGAEWLFRRWLGIGSAPAVAEGEIADRPVKLLSEFMPLVVFALASAGLLPDVRVAAAAAAVRARIPHCSHRFPDWCAPSSGVLLRPPQSYPGSAERLLPLDDRQATFWFTRVQAFAGIFLFGWAMVSLMPHLGFSVDVRRLVAFALGLGLLAIGIEVVWRRPDLVGRLYAFRAWLTTFFLVLLWFLWVAGFNGLLWIGIYALILPPTVRGVGRVAAQMVGAGNRESLSMTLVDVLVVRGARTAVIGLAVAWLAYVFQETLVGSPRVERIVEGLLHGIIVILVADLVWQLSKAAIEYRLKVVGSGESADEIARSGRLRTLLPIFRNALAVFIGVVAALTILSGLGVQIMPLIAGAGIFGVAIGFGSQTLVKDVLSGVFFMLDDAFRVGEYIESGSYKGTVESFSLRSVRLRHHRGPVFTVPFGDLGAVQNLSRDWVMEKIVMTVTYNFRRGAGPQADQEDRPGARRGPGVQGEHPPAPQDAGRRQLRRIRDRAQDEADDQARRTVRHQAKGFRDDQEGLRR